MQLRLIRLEFSVVSTRGILLLDETIICCTLEDCDRQIEGQPVSEWKVPGSTCIPRGIYQCGMQRSPRFNAMRPHLFSVPGFTHIMFHEGNSAADVAGCIAVGDRFAHSPNPYTIQQSQPALLRLCNALAHTSTDNTIPLTII